MKKVKEGARSHALLQLDVIEPVHEPKDWFSSIAVVPKADGNVRTSVDLAKLNQAVLRNVYYMPTVEETLGSLTGGSAFPSLMETHVFTR